MKIFKYIIEVDDQWHQIDLPMRAEIILVDSQGTTGSVCMWVFQNPELAKKMRWFRVYGTGREIPQDCKPVGSCITAENHLVWHLMERI
jgi:hypothetical protein